MRVVYLKVNRPSDYFISSVKNVVEVLEFLQDTKIFLICDNPGIQNWINAEVDLSKLKCEWIPSERKAPDMVLLMDKVTDPDWHNAGFAHMTTFWHARENHFENFWNMDADDVRFFDPPEKVAKMFEEVERVASEKKIKIFSLDMWSTLSQGFHWTFGITYTDNKFPWFDTIKNIITNELQIENYYRFLARGRNVDWFFTFMRFMRYFAGIESFYVENLRFAHHLPDLFLNHCAGVRYCSNGRYHIPLFENEFGLGSDGSIPIDQDVYKIDIGLTEQDSYDYFYKNYHSPGMLDSFRTINRVAKIPESDLKMSVVIDLEKDGNPENFLNLLKKQTSDFQLYFLDDPKLFVARRLINKHNLFFPNGIKIVPKNQFKYNELKTSVAIAFDGSEDEETINSRFKKARGYLKK